MPKKKKSTKKKPSNKKITKRQADALKKHSQHHTKKHMAEMRRNMKGGASFTTAHRNAMRKVGK